LSKITPGERAGNWAQALMTLWPLIIALVGAGAYGNSETIKHWVHGEPLPETPGEISPLMGDEIHPEVRAKIESILNKLEEQDTRFNRIESKSRRDDHQLSDRVNIIEGLVN